MSYSYEEILSISYGALDLILDLKKAYSKYLYTLFFNTLSLFTLLLYNTVLNHYKTCLPYL